MTSQPRLAYLGPEGTFTHRAALTVPVQRRIPVRSIRGVFEAIESGIADEGVVPAENVFAGAVDETLDFLLVSELYVHGEIVLPIEHLLLGHADRRIARVYSHPQALAQCEAWLDRNHPDAERIECASTGEAAALAAADDEGAAIAAERLANLDILATGLAHSGNVTRFFLVGDGPAPPTGRDRTLIGFTVAHRPGSLHECLGAFAAEGINLLRIESRPSRREAWTYRFVVEMEGHPDDPALARALKNLEGCTAWQRVLGAWPVPGGEKRR